MKNLVKLIAATFLMVSGAVSATPITDVQEYSNNTATEYFVIDDDNKYNSPYYRGASSDWSWVHTAIAGTFTSISLDISAFDVDTPDELDAIFVFDGASWLNLGNLVGTDNTWAFTSFDLSGFSWASAQVNAGLQVKVDIDTADAGWIVTLGKASLITDGGNQECVPTPGIPCTTTPVPEPSTLAIFALGMIGFASRRSKK